jgi:hypothetical protein
VPALVAILIHTLSKPTGVQCCSMPCAGRLFPKNSAGQTASVSIARNLDIALASERERGGPTPASVHGAITPRPARLPLSPMTTGRHGAHSTHARSFSTILETFRRVTT